MMSLANPDMEDNSLDEVLALLQEKIRLLERPDPNDPNTPPPLRLKEKPEQLARYNTKHSQTVDPLEIHEQRLARWKEFFKADPKPVTSPGEHWFQILDEECKQRKSTFRGVGNVFEFWNKVREALWIDSDDEDDAEDRRQDERRALSNPEAKRPYKFELLEWTLDASNPGIEEEVFKHDPVRYGREGEGAIARWRSSVYNNLQPGLLTVIGASIPNPLEDIPEHEREEDA